MAGRLGLVAWLIASLLAAPLCPLVCTEVQIPPVHDVPSAAPGSCHEKSVPAGDHLPAPDSDGSPFHSCERCAHLQQAVKGGKSTLAVNPAFPVSGFLDYRTSGSSGQQPIEIERHANPPASPPGIEPILRI